MTSIPTLVITPGGAADTYRRNGAPVSGDIAGSFAASIDQAMQSAIQTGHTADRQAMKAVSGDGNLTEVVTALSKAELTLQTVTTIRDKVVQAVQDIMKMPI